MLEYTFYKIAIKGTKYCYIGSSLNATQRLKSHKDSCHNPLTTNHHVKLYQTIRDNGGWENTETTIISTQKFETKEQVLIQEQKYIVQHKATLNMVPATTASVNTLIEMKNMTPSDTYENKKKRQKLLTSIWKKTHGKEKYNTWQHNYMRGKQQYNRQVKILFNCLSPVPTSL